MVHQFGQEELSMMVVSARGFIALCTRTQRAAAGRGDGSWHGITLIVVAYHQPRAIDTAIATSMMVNSDGLNAPITIDSLIDWNGHTICGHIQTAIHADNFHSLSAKTTLQWWEY